MRAPRSAVVRELDPNFFDGLSSSAVFPIRESRCASSADETPSGHIPEGQFTSSCESAVHAAPRSSAPPRPNTTSDLVVGACKRARPRLFGKTHIGRPSADFAAVDPRTRWEAVLPLDADRSSCPPVRSIRQSHPFPACCGCSARIGYHIACAVGKIPGAAKRNRVAIFRKTRNLHSQAAAVVIDFRKRQALFAGTTEDRFPSRTF